MGLMSLSEAPRSGWQNHSFKSNGFSIFPVLTWIPSAYDANQIVWRGLEVGWGFWHLRWLLVTVLPGALPQEISWQPYLSWYEGVFKRALPLAGIQKFISERSHWQTFLRYGGLQSYYGRLLLARAFDGSLPGL